MVKINYQQLAAEFVIVFIGVAVALAADEWRQNLQDQGMEKTYLARVLEDLKVGENQLSIQKSRIDIVIESAVSLSDALSGDAPPISDSEMVEQFIQSARTGFAQSGLEHDSTYKELNSSGRLNLIRDSLLRQELTDYYRMIDILIEETEDNPRELIVRHSRLTGWFAYYFAQNNATLREGDKARILNELHTNTSKIAEELRSISANVRLNENRLASLLLANTSLVVKLEQILE